jgi:hypothetical protein
VEKQLPKLPFDSVKSGHIFYQSQVDEIEAAGIELLWKARKALEFYEGMPEAINYHQAHDAANLLRMNIIPALERDYQDIFTCLGSDTQSELAGVEDPRRIFNWYENKLPEYRKSQQNIKQALFNLPAWSVIQFLN